MEWFRRDFLKLAGGAVAAGAVNGICANDLWAQSRGATPQNAGSGFFNVRSYRATGDGKTLDTRAINAAILAAHDAGGGTVYFPAGVYASYSIRLKSQVILYLEQGATILAAESPAQATSIGAYDLPEPHGEWEQYQKFGHNHFHNSLIWGEDLCNVGIMGPGMIWGKGLSPGRRTPPLAETPGAGNKSIALKSCRNVILRDFSILKGGHFAVLATGVDNLTIDNLKIDTDRDGMDLVCCRNVRVSNCSVNSPLDDAICPKSQMILGELRSTENVTITNCFVTGGYEIGSMLDGTWKRLPDDTSMPRAGRIKCGTESNCGFKNITISNCVFERSQGFALETVDGAAVEDITFSGITMRECSDTPIFMRLGARMRAPANLPVGSMKRVLIGNVVSSRSHSRFGGGGLLAGIPGHCIEDVKIHDIYLSHMGGGTKEMAAIVPDERIKRNPDPKMFGDLPASGFFLRHLKNLEMTNVELAWSRQDARPAFWMQDVDGVDIFRLKLPKLSEKAVQFVLDDVRDFRLSASRGFEDTSLEHAVQKQL